MYFTLAVLVVAAILFAVGKIRSDLVALCALLALLLRNVLTVDEALSGFSNSIVIMMVGLFVVGGAVFQTGLAKLISAKILRLAGNSELGLFLLVMLATCGIGCFVSNTGTVALMMPIVVSIAATFGMSASRLLMPLAFASSMGGMMTLIGTAPNLVISNELVKHGHEALSFFSFTPVGIVCVITGIIVLVPLSKRLVRKDKKGPAKNRSKSLQELADEYQLSKGLYRTRVKRGSQTIGKTIGELNLKAHELSVLEVRRESGRSHFLKSVSQQMATADTMLREGDILYLRGHFENARDFSQAQALQLIDTHTPEAADPAQGQPMEFYDIGIAEVLLLPDAKLLNQKVEDSGLRENYGLNILGIRRKKEYFLKDIKDQKLQKNDAVLVQGTWENIARASSENGEWVVLGQPLKQAAAVTLDYRAPTAGLIMVGMIAAMVFGAKYVAPVTAVMIAAILTILTGCFRNVQAAYKTINWESVVLIAAMLPMSIAMENTGASKMISSSLVSALGDFGPFVLLAGIYFTTSFLTMFISNTATAVLLAPIAYQSAISMEVSPYPFLFAVSVGASMCFASPFSTPPNALVMNAGQYTFMDYVKIGGPLQIIMGIVMVIALPLIFPFAG